MTKILIDNYGKKYYYLTHKKNRKRMIASTLTAVSRFRCFSNAIYNGRCFCTVDGVNHFPVFLADTKSTNCSLGCIVVHRNIAIVKDLTTD